MHRAQFAKSYQAVAVSTATPGQLVLMLFDGALRFISTAQHGFGAEPISTRNEQINNNLIKAQRILRELQCSLDMELGGEFSTRMFALYDFMIEQLTQANLTKMETPIKVVEKLLSEVRDSWSQMLEQSQTKAA